MVTEFHNVNDVFAAAQQLRDRLMAQGESRAAKELDDTITCFWTTSSEALGEIKVTLLQVRSTVERTLDKESLALLDSAVNGAARLWGSG